MRLHTLFGLAAGLFLIAVVLAVAPTIADDETSPPADNGRADNADSKLDAATVTALHEALLDERKARATYRAVIRAFGPVRPFVNIVEAESRHELALLQLFARYELPVPPDPWAPAPPAPALPGAGENRPAGGDNRGAEPAPVAPPIHVPATLKEACAAAAQAERENVALYDRVLASVRQPDIRQVFASLRDASQNRHLPAFERCQSRGRR